MIESPHQKFNLFFILHSIRMLTALRIPPDYQLLLQVLEDLKSQLWSLRSLPQLQSLQSWIVKPEHKRQSLIINLIILGCIFFFMFSGLKDKLSGWIRGVRLGMIGLIFRSNKLLINTYHLVMMLLRCFIGKRHAFTYYISICL